jgi:hypothetical protein
MAAVPVHASLTEEHLVRTEQWSRSMVMGISEYLKGKSGKPFFLVQEALELESRFRKQSYLNRSKTCYCSQVTLQKMSQTRFGQSNYHCRIAGKSYYGRTGRGQTSMFTTDQLLPNHTYRWGSMVNETAKNIGYVKEGNKALIVLGDFVKYTC